MKFRITPEAIERLGLDPVRAGQVFDGYTNREGLLGGVPRGILKWVKRELKIDRIEYLDAADGRLVYYLIAIRNVDHTLLPISRIDELATTDFQLEPHLVTSLDQDGDCGECSQPIDAKLHRVYDEDGQLIEQPEVPPTQGPGSPATTETATT
jgi:hypothetical protein